MSFNAQSKIYWPLLVLALGLSGCGTIATEPPAEDASTQPAAGAGLFVDDNGERRWLLPSALTHTGQGRYQWADGRTYSGAWEDGVPSGQGSGTLADGRHYQGEWRAGLPEGQGQWQTPDGEEYQGQLVAGRRQGQGQHHSNAGDYEGQWHDDRPHGAGKFHGTDGSQYQGQYQQGKRHGSGRYVSSHGVVFDGDWLEDEPNGFGIMLSADGSRHEGQWLAGQSHGYGRYSHPAGLHYQGSWISGKREGFGEEQRPDGSRYQGDWVANQPHGKGLLEQADGERAEGHWHSGKMSGIGTRRYAQGYELAGEWQNGLLLEGTLRTLSPSAAEYQGPLQVDNARKWQARAVEWLTKQAADSNAPAAYLLALQAATPAAAMAWYRQAANANIAAAQLALGKSLLATDLREALLWLNKAADATSDNRASGPARGNAQAQFLLGTLYHFGQQFPQDEDQAETFYQAAIDGGSLPARRNLALMLATTSIDYLRDPARALALIEPLANLYRSASGFDALATVYAANDQFPAASYAQQAAIDALTAQEPDRDTADAIRTMRLRLEQFTAKSQEPGEAANDEN